MNYIWDKERFGEGGYASLKLGDDTFFLVRRESKGETTPEGSVMVDVYSSAGDLLFRIAPIDESKGREKVFAFSSDFPNYADHIRENYPDDITRGCKKDYWTFHWEIDSAHPFTHKEILERFEANGLIPPAAFDHSKGDMPEEKWYTQDLQAKNLRGLTNLFAEEEKTRF